MAGTIFGLGLSQRVDLNGKPSVGWLVYLYAANSSTPVDSYQDTGLTVKNSWPLEADANGMLPQFWLADGSYRARGTNNDGSIIYFDIPSAQSLGPSAGSAPSGGVDPNAIFATGDVMWQDIQGTRTGWVRDNGRTLGSATSGASERANADCANLFEWLWNNFSDTICPVVGGRGASAVADWNANKQITMPDKRGYVVGGLDDMGNTAASRWTGVPVVTGTVTSAGSIVGEVTHTISSTEIPAHNHSINIVDPGHNHTWSYQKSTGVNSGSFAQPVTTVATTGQPNTLTVTTSTTGITATSTNTGGGTAHNNVQKTVLGTFFRKL